MNDESDLLATIAQGVVHLDVAVVRTSVESAVREGISPFRIVAEGLSQGMRTVGALFRDGELFMPEVLVACDTYYAGLQLVQPLIEKDNGRIAKGKIVLGTIHGDIHTVGKDVAIPVFRAAGFDVVDLGTDVADEAFVEAVRQHQPDIVGLGTYMTSTFMHTNQTVEALERAGLRGQVKVICGGPAVDVRAALKLGADGATDNAWEGVQIMEAWMAEVRE
ncbi:MAG: cobalamin-binding protein [Planctomycetota bacterium]|nr:MAG: cobalamin-binding protein [Planctomycetota bacterium]